MKKSQTITFWIVILLIVIVMFQMSRMGESKSEEITYTEFMRMVDSGEVARVGFDEKDVTITGIDGQNYSTYLPFEAPELVKSLAEKGIIVYSQKPSQLLGILLSWFPFLLFIGVWIFIMRGMRGGAGQAFSFGKSKARLATDGKTKVTFKDVAGVDEAKEELEEIVEFLKAPKKFQKLGGRIPRGVLLLGRPGTGKTLLAKAVAGEAKVPFFSISGSDFVEMFVGVGASRVRDMFLQAKKNAPCIAFIDEIDAVGRHRGSGLGGGHDEREQTLNQLLVEMDGFDPNDSVIIIAATNRPDVLDPALLRPGRFDRQVIVDLPDIKGREEILKVHTRILPIAKEVSFAVVARVTPGFSGADLANLVNEAALLAARKNKKKIEMDDFDEAKDKVTMGKARKSKVITDEDKKITAVHEVGHVLCSMFLDKVEPIHKVTIIPRGFSGGATHFMQTDKTYYTRTYMQQTIVGLMGGRTAEEIIFNELSTGASNDIERATNLAKQMVCNLGMSEKIGPMTVAKKESQVFLGKDISQHENISEETAKLIDSEIRSFIENAHKTSNEILMKHKKLLENMSETLLEKETLEADEIYQIAKDNCPKEEQDFIDEQFKKVQEMKIDLSKKDFSVKPDEKKESEAKEPEKQDSEKTDKTEDKKDETSKEVKKEVKTKKEQKEPEKEEDKDEKK
ncbi:MAG: ATP-dependent zinc metalloprotease FtsH [Candidatus Cloacimonetes bacterium]|nr:ATP-dependent zinc metalloprotease FtsH [Candidatus Cloacimonadota bacterium]MCF7814451.1 ATP-dependent zinc metalloprotease FtsH [Candidatus Cloacimonadota bacterium]MCF7869026.1 ATP-dependent zinc metalloprotease FtsH [Candidatus Cloacimonadota bacterium]MCF7884421.1 ATP-dependent zinc metalloprotease FtsH [Candidatus Cloacimonadota bacterium]